MTTRTQRHKVRDASPTSRWSGLGNLSVPHRGLRKGPPAHFKAVVTIDQMLASTGGGLDYSVAR